MKKFFQANELIFDTLKQAMLTTLTFHALSTLDQLYGQFYFITLYNYTVSTTFANP